MFPKSITKEEILELPLWQYEGPVKVISDDESLDEALHEIHKAPVLGFDTETKPAFKKGVYNPVALIQLATEDQVWVIQNLLAGFPKKLIDVFENKEIIKTGAAIHDDLKDLQKIRKFQPQSFVDLNQVARELEMKNSGLRNMCGIFLEKRISKGQQTSNWEREELSEKQIIYAATDAYVSLEIFLHLRQQGWLDL